MPVVLTECRSALSPSRLPGLDWALNPYRGCGHACAYCYAQDVTKFHLDQPWGETVEVRTNIAPQLRKAARKGIRGVVGVGTVTDPYQPLEKEHALTRGCLGILKGARARVSVLTKSDLVLRDIDLLSSLPGAEVGISIGTADERLARLVETSAPSPSRRFEALKKLTEAGVDTYLMAAPIIRKVWDSEGDVERLVGMAGAAGARRIIWDVFNPKPIASARLRNRLSSASMDLPRPHSPEEVRWLRSLFDHECRDSGIELSDAF